jgi:hypothetical protein
MKQGTKLKPITWGRSVVVGSIMVILFFTIFATVRTVMAQRSADVICGIMYLVVTAACLFGWFKAKQVHIIPIMFMNLMQALYFFAGLRILMVIVNVALLILVIYMFTVFFKHKALHRKVLELAARPVKDVQNGFTNRPRPSGKADYSKGELYGFSEFLRRKNIAIPYVESNGIALALPEDWLGRLYNAHGHYSDDTRIIFQFDCNVSAMITEGDYKKYQEELSFDQLCASMGNLFVEFLELFKNGEGERILDRLNRFN